MGGWLMNDKLERVRKDMNAIAWHHVDLSYLTLNRGEWRAVVNAVMNLRFPSSAGNFLTSWGPLSFSGRILFHGVGGSNLSRHCLRIYHEVMRCNTLWLGDGPVLRPGFQLFTAWIQINGVTFNATLFLYLMLKKAVYVLGHYFIWQISFANSFWFDYHVTEANRLKWQTIVVR